MIINFDEIREEKIANFKGGDGNFVVKMYVDDSVRVLKGYLEKGSSIGMHKHEGTTETIFITGGTGKVIYDGKEEILTAGSCSYCPDGHEHSLINTGDGPLYLTAVVPKVR